MSTIKVIKDLPDTETQAMILPVIEGAYEDVKNLIPELPQEIEVHFDDWCLIPDLGTGAAAYDPNTLVLYFDKEFKGDLGAQIKDLHATVFHEAFHIAHGWTFESNTAVGDRAGTAIEQAFYEGCAIVFERDYADSKTPIGDYSKLDNVNEL
ncbi:MAG: hypothetical protein QG623_172, partial [Patescibacteria group bacterium]|nr:hypothetical protein [Patescibacteria group bacterium]